MPEKQTYVKDAITEGMLKLMKEKSIDDISICELTDYAKVGRVSFYRNFRDKDDILRYYIISETDRWLGSTDKNYLTTESPQEFLIFLLEHLYQYRETIASMLRDGKMYLLEEESEIPF